MKILRSSMFRAICAIATGILLLNNPDSTVKGITIAIGVMFFVSGAISCATYLSEHSGKDDIEIYDAQGQPVMRRKPVFPIVGVGSVILGVILIVMPGTFVTSLMYMLGALLILGAVNQFVTLVGVRKIGSVPLWFWLCPSLTLVTGLFVVIKPMETASLPLLIIGWCLLFYGVTECINAIKIYVMERKIRHLMKDEAVTIEDSVE
ncbi:MAG: HdeD family acid-resistance protein [Prevotella sp.]